MSNPPESGAEGLSDIPEPTTTANDNETRMTEEENMNALYPLERIYAASYDDAPDPSLASAGERAMVVLGLSSPSVPSIHIRPSWTLNSNIHWPPETRQFFMKKTVDEREHAQECARRADQWRHERDELAAELSGTSRWRNYGMLDERKLWSLHRHACLQVERYEKGSIRSMEVAYQYALLALHKGAMSSEEIRALDKQ